MHTRTPQVLSIFANTQAQWPSAIIRIYTYLSLFSFNLNITAPECIFSISYSYKWFVVESMPLVALSMVGLVHMLTQCYLLYKKKMGGKDIADHSSEMIGLALTSMYMIYLYMSETALDVFNCGQVVSEDGVTDGKHYMNSEPNEVCYEDGSMQQFLMPYAAVAICVYSLGYPLLLTYILFNPGNRQKIRQDQLLRACNKGDTERSNPFCYAFRKRYARLYYNFKPVYWYWVILTVMRKLSIVSAALIFRTNPTFQLCVILLIMFGAYVCQTKYQPWMSNMEKAEVVEQHKEEIEILQDRINEVNDRKVTQYSHHSGAGGRRFKKLTLGNTYEVKGRPTAERAAAFIWNYNT